MDPIAGEHFYLDKKFPVVQVEGSGVVSTPVIVFSGMLKKQKVDLGRFDFKILNGSIEKFLAFLYNFMPGNYIDHD